jgi:hypothetical protein
MLHFNCVHSTFIAKEQPMSKTTISASATGLPASDPVFKALEKVRRAKASYEEAKQALKEIENANMKVAFPFKFRATIAGETKVVSSLFELQEWINPKAPNYAEMGVFEIGRLAERFYGVKMPPYNGASAEAMKKWSDERDSILAAFDQAKKEYDDAYKAAGLDVVQKRINRAWTAFDKAEAAVLKTQPTTPAGGVALVQFCAEYLARYNACDGVDAALVNAMIALSSGTEIIISQQLASAYAYGWPENKAKSDLPPALVESYHTWLFHEFNALGDELSPEGRHRRGDWVWVNNAGDRFHWGTYGEPPKPLPSTRAAAILTAAGIPDWQEEQGK